MNHREITKPQAHAVLKILNEECGLRLLDPRDGDAFIRQVVTVENDHACAEYRFGGALGFGGKFRNNGNCNNVPYVDCYREDETPARLGMIKAANKRLAELFA